MKKVGVGFKFLSTLEHYSFLNALYSLSFVVCKVRLVRRANFSEHDSSYFYVHQYPNFFYKNFMGPKLLGS